LILTKTSDCCFRLDDSEDMGGRSMDFGVRSADYDQDSADENVEFLDAFNGADQ
jgi:hypothetical protein